MPACFRCNLNGRPPEPSFPRTRCCSVTDLASLHRPIWGCLSSTTCEVRQRRQPPRAPHPYYRHSDSLGVHHSCFGYHSGTKLNLKLQVVPGFSTFKARLSLRAPVMGTLFCCCCCRLHSARPLSPRWVSAGASVRWPGQATLAVWLHFFRWLDGVHPKGHTAGF